MPRLRDLPKRLYSRLFIAEQLMQLSPTALPPEWVKHDYLRRWQENTGYHVFVETGTCHGDTTSAVASAFRECHTIEFDRTLYERAVARMRPLDNVVVYQGDSAVVIKEILAKLREPAIFWLDAHYCGGATGKTLKDPPIREELDAIFAHDIDTHVILVDDARLFNGFDNYPTIKQVISYVRARSPYQVRVFQDAIHIYRDLL